MFDELVCSMTVDNTAWLDSVLCCVTRPHSLRARSMIHSLVDSLHTSD